MATAAINSLREEREPTIRTPLLRSTTQLEDKTKEVATRALKDGPLLGGIFIAQDVARGLNTAVTAVTVAATGDQNGGLATMPLALGPSMVAAGVLNVQIGADTAKTAYKSGDEVGLISGVIRVPRGVADVTRGGVTTAQTGLQIANKAPGVAATLGLIGSVGAGVGIIAIGATSTMNLAQTMAISGVFNKKCKEEGEEGAFNYLKKLLSTTEEDKAKVLDEIFIPQKDSWSRKAKSYLAEKFLGTKESKEDAKLKDAFQKAATQPELLEAYIKIAEEPLVDAKVYPEGVKEKIEDRLRKMIPNYNDLSGSQKEKLIALVYGLYETGLKNTQDKKEAVFERTVGSDTKKLLQPLMTKQEDVAPAEIKEVVACAKKGLRGNAIRQSIITIGCMLGMVGLVLAQIASSGIYFFVELAINLVSTAIWLGMDGYYLYKSYTETHALMKDKVLMFVATLAMVVAGTVAVALAKSTLNLALTASFCVVWLALAVYGVYTWKTAKETEQRPAISEEDVGYGSGSSGEPIGNPLAATG